MSQKSSHRAHSLQILSLVLVAWLSIVITPCVRMATLHSAEAAVATQSIDIDCHGGHAKLQAGDTDCRCDPLVLARNERTETQRTEFVAVTSAMRENSPVAADWLTIQSERPLVADADSPPLYLVTQRLRI